MRKDYWSTTFREITRMLKWGFSLEFPLMKRYLPFLFPIVIFLSVSLACQSLPVASTSSAGSQTPSPKVLYQDDFKNPSSGWSNYTDANGENGYKDGSYHILINKPDMFSWSVPGVNLTDVAIDVDIQKKAGPNENEFGVICRYKDENNFYFLTVSSDGYYGVSKLLDGKRNLIGMDQLQQKDGVIHPETSNHIRAECSGNTLKLSANGQLLANVTDTSFTEGDVGLIAISNETTGLDIYYDHFLVTQP